MPDSGQLINVRLLVLAVLCHGRTIIQEHRIPPYSCVEWENQNFSLDFVTLLKWRGIGHNDNSAQRWETYCPILMTILPKMTNTNTLSHWSDNSAQRWQTHCPVLGGCGSTTVPPRAVVTCWGSLGWSLRLLSHLHRWHRGFGAPRAHQDPARWGALPVPWHLCPRPSQPPWIQALPALTGIYFSPKNTDFFHADHPHNSSASPCPSSSCALGSADIVCKQFEIDEENTE